MLPHGEEARKETLGVAKIRNTGESGSLVFGDYEVELKKWGPSGRRWRKGTVTRFPRLRLGPWDLLYRALRDCVGTRNPDVETTTTERTHDEVTRTAGGQ